MRKNNINFAEEVDSFDPFILVKELERRVLFEDNHLIIVVKRAGEIVQGDKTKDIPLVEMIKYYLKIKYNKQGNVFCGLVHRIDRPVGGIVIFAKTSKALSRMNTLIKEREIKKTYWALTEKPLPNSEGTLIGYLKKNEQQNKSYHSFKPIKSYKYAELSYKILDYTDRYVLTEIDLVTGRHHQIRAQLAANGAVIKGDLKYGAKRSNPDGSISLYAKKITFEHPVSHQMITVEYTPDFFKPKRDHEPK
ncbi:MAG: RNA pseudouridine synthase [Bacteroidales bacterium]|jgi:23S rRNA pseudouridine1911/1915/1917 synthase|nr:RNA pseudouridine synthase [Bacteroidales bacterium]